MIKTFKKRSVPKSLRPEILMEPQLMKPLHRVNPRTILGSEWWDEKRQEAYAKKDYHCWACGVHKSKAPYRKWLEAHESYHIDFEKYRYTLVEIVALCYCCHNFIHMGRLQAMYEIGNIKDWEYKFIVNRGNTILKKAGLDKHNAWWLKDGIYEQFFPEKNRTWRKWHLMLEGEKHYSPFRNFDEYVKFMDEENEKK